jgi:FkbM family methyltransferase
MNLYKLDEMVGGWFVGNFSPTAFSTKDVEVSYKKHPKGELWDTHYHEHVTEVNLLVRGEMILQGKKLISGDIFILNPYEIADPEFLEDCEIVCVKHPGITNDKIVLKNMIDYYANYKNYVNENDVIVQIGAFDGVECEENYGLREIIMMDNHECHLVEPLPETFLKLQTNYKSSVNDIKFYNLAIYSSDGEQDFYTNGTESSFVRHTDCEKIKVKTRTFDSFLKENSIQNIDCLFLDVEGVEDMIINQLFESTSIRPKVIRYEYPHIQDNDLLEKFISSNGYVVMQCIFGAGDKVCVRSDVLKEKNEFN